MAILQGDTPTLTLYSTVSLPSSVLQTIKRDFALGANEGYNPFCRLDISSRTDLFGLKTPEDVLRRLQAEGVYSQERFTPFLLADERTLEHGEDGVVWFVHRWAEPGDFDEGALVDGADGIEDGHYMFAHKELVYSYYAPVLYVNLEIANTDIAEGYTYPFDPSARTEPTDVGCDWRFEEPTVAYVVADKSQYDTITMSQYERLDDPRAMRLDGESEDKDERLMYRLKEEVADRLGLKPSWYMASPFTSWDHGNMETRRRLEEEVKDRESAVSFAQEWKWTRPEGIEERVAPGMEIPGLEGLDDIDEEA